MNNEPSNIDLSMSLYGLFGTLSHDVYIRLVDTYEYLIAKACDFSLFIPPPPPRTRREGKGL